MTDSSAAPEPDSARVPGDHFSGVAQAYAAYRPGYPDALFVWLAAAAPSRALAWDCGAGSGQATVPLAARFERVLATDVSAQQLAGAPSLPNVEYRVAPAESSGLAHRSADLVTVAQALHWFPIERFMTEVERVLVPGGVFAAWSYNWLRTGDDRIDDLLMHLGTGIVGPYWPPERILVEHEYRTIPFPFEELAVPPFAMAADWTLPHVLGYLRTWSAVARYQAAHEVDPVREIESQLANEWGPQITRRVTWPLVVRAGRRSGSDSNLPEIGV